MVIKKYFYNAYTALRGKTNGGVLYLLPQIALNVVYLVPLMFIWRIITENGGNADAGMSLSQLLTYTYMNALLADLTIVRTFISDWDYDGRNMAVFTRPMSVYGQVISRTAGEWLPGLALFSLPMIAVAPLLGIQTAPATLWAVPSLFLCASLGFAFEFLFYCVTLRLRNVSWLTHTIRSAVVSFFSGTVIPFKILPFGLDRWISYQPFGSLGALAVRRDRAAGPRDPRADFLERDHMGRGRPMVQQIEGTDGQLRRLK